MKELVQSLLSELGLEVAFLQGWMVQVFLVVFAALLLDFLQRLVLKRISRRAKKRNHLWLHASLEAIRAPLSLVIWLLGMLAGADIAAVHSEGPWFDHVDEVRRIGVIAALTWFALRVTRTVERGILDRAHRNEEDLDYTTVDAIGKLARIAIFITAGLVTLQNLGFSISGVLAFGGVGGLAVGLAARDLLANFFGGFTVYMDRPFSVGDWIRSPDRNIEGTVEYIGWRQTRIRTFEKRPLYVPNSIFMNVVVENPSRMSHRRIFETIGVRYDDIHALPDIVHDVEHMLAEHEGVDANQTLMVFFTQFGPSSLDFFVYCFTKTVVWAEYHRIKQEIMFRISDIIADHGAEIAFPTTTVHVPDTLEFAGLDGREPEPVRERRERSAVRPARATNPNRDRHGSDDGGNGGE